MSFVLEVPGLLALRLAGFEDGIARRAKPLPERPLVALRQRERLGVRLPPGLDRLDPRRCVALHRRPRERGGLVDQRLPPRPGLAARRRQRIAQRRDRGLEPGVAGLPGTGIEAAEITFAPRAVRLAQPPLDGAPVARLGQQRLRVRRRGGDELVAALARVLLLSGHFREVPGGRRIRGLARAVESLPQRPGHAGVLPVERLPRLAQLPDLGGDPLRVERRCRRGLGALAQLHARVPLAERLPALELRELRDDPAQPLRRRLRQRAGVGLAGPDLLGGMAGCLQLPGGERLLGGVQQRVDALPCAARLLLRGVHLRQPALLDRDQRRLEALREVRRAQRPVQRLPAFGQLGVVDGRAAGELLGFGDQRGGRGLRFQVERPLRDPLLGLVEQRECRVRGDACRLVAQRGELAAQQGERLRGGRWFSPARPFAQPAFEPRPHPLFVVLAIEARLQRLARRIRPRDARGVVAEVERLPAAVELDRRREDRRGRGRQRFQLQEQRVGLRRPAGTIGDRVDPLAREPGHAVVPVPRAVGEPAQAVRRVHALGGGEPRLRVLGRQRDLDQRGFVAQCGDRDEAAVGVECAQRDVGPDRVGAARRSEQRGRGVVA